MSLRVAVAMVAAALAGCSSAGSGPSGGSGGSTGGSTGSVDAGPGCYSLDAGCTQQSDCGETRGSIEVYACQLGHCVFQGQRDARCAAVEPLMQIRVNVVNSMINTSTIGSFEVRALYPFRVDGGPLLCSAVRHQADFSDGGNPLDVDPTLQFENVGAYPAGQPQSASSFALDMTLVGQTQPVLLVQAYTGRPGPSGTASGQRLAEGCIDGVVDLQAKQQTDVNIE